MSFRALISAMLFTAAACTRDQPPADPPLPPATPPAAPAAAAVGPSTVVSGVVVFEPQMVFRACDGSPIVTLLDSTSNRLRPLVGLSGSTDEQGLFVIAQGGTAPTRELVLREIHYAVRPAAGLGCDLGAPEYSVAIGGIDTTWRVTVTPQAIEYQEAGGSPATRFGAATGTDSAGVTVYSTSDQTAGRSLRITLTPGSCRDPRTMAYTPYAASVTVDGKTLRGCAWKGRLS
jgi:uncharacterized membrane protein